MRCVGAPKGGRVHWLLWSLPREFKNSYILAYNYDKHNYCFYRLSGHKLYDIFIISHTSKHYFRMSYFNSETTEILFDGDNKATRLAKRMWYIFKIDQRRKESENKQQRIECAIFFTEMLLERGVRGKRFFVVPELAERPKERRNSETRSGSDTSSNCPRSDAGAPLKLKSSVANGNKREKTFVYSLINHSINRLFYQVFSLLALQALCGLVMLAFSRHTAQLSANKLKRQ